MDNQESGLVIAGEDIAAPTPIPDARPCDRVSTGATWQPRAGFPRIRMLSANIWAPLLESKGTLGMPLNNMYMPTKSMSSRVCLKNKHLEPTNNV